MDDELYSDMGGVTAAEGLLDAALYEGLFAAPSASAGHDTYFQHKADEFEELLRERDSEVRALKGQLEAREQQFVELTSERDTLLRNISCLYNTAKEEMARKQAEITNLRAEVAQLKQRPAEGLASGAARSLQQAPERPHERPGWGGEAGAPRRAGGEGQAREAWQRQERGRMPADAGDGTAAATVARHSRERSAEAEQQARGWGAAGLPSGSGGGRVREPSPPCKRDNLPGPPGIGACASQCGRGGCVERDKPSRSSDTAAPGGSEQLRETAGRHAHGRDRMPTDAGGGAATAKRSRDDLESELSNEGQRHSSGFRESAAGSSKRPRHVGSGDMPPRQGPSGPKATHAVDRPRNDHKAGPSRPDADGHEARAGNALGACARHHGAARELRPSADREKHDRERGRPHSSDQQRQDCTRGHARNADRGIGSDRGHDKGRR